MVARRPVFIFVSIYMRGVIENIDGMRATIRLQDGDPLTWPTAKLPPGSRVTSVVEVSMHLALIGDTDHAEASRRQLNEILASTPDA